MAVKCDTRRHVVRREQQGSLSAIVDERFQGCAAERAIIVETEQGRAGLCEEHLIEYNVYRQKNSGQPTKDRTPWARLRRGLVIMGDEIPMSEEA